MQRALPAEEGLQGWVVPRSDFKCSFPGVCPRGSSLRFPANSAWCSQWKAAVHGCCREAFCWHTGKAGRRGGNRDPCRVKTAEVWQFKAVWQKISLLLHFPDGVQLFAIPSYLFSNLVANHSSAPVCSSSPPSHQLSLLAHLLTSQREQICCLVWSPLARPSQAISASPPRQKVSESPFICFFFLLLVTFSRVRVYLH